MYNFVNYTVHSNVYRAQTGIKAGEEITTRYVSSTLGNYRYQPKRKLLGRKPNNMISYYFLLLYDWIFFTFAPI